MSLVKMDARTLTPYEAEAHFEHTYIVEDETLVDQASLEVRATVFDDKARAYRWIIDLGAREFTYIYRVPPGTVRAAAAVR